MRIRVTDLETTGIEPTDAVVEIAAWDVVVDGGRASIEEWGDVLVNPGRPIPPEVSAIHHLVDEDVAGRMKFDDAVRPAMIGADAFCAHNAKFERQWITKDLTGDRPWICTLRCAYRVWPDAPSHSNQALRYWLAPAGLDREIAAVAHRAGPDAYVTAFTLRELLKKATVSDLIEWSSQPAILPRVQFGKHRGMKWTDVPVDYLSWILRQADMDEDVKHTARHWMQQPQRVS